MPELQNLDTKKQFRKGWHELFEFAILVKAFNGIWEIASGISIIFLSKEQLNRLFFRIAGKGVLDHPHDQIIIYISKFLEHLSTNTRLFIGIYILAHGLLNIFLSVQLYRKKIWAYLLTIYVMLAFIVYQIYRINQHHSKILFLITIFDLLFIILTWHEYKYSLSKKNNLGVNQV